MTEAKVRVSRDLYEQLQKLADKTGRSIRQLVDESIKAYLLGTEHIEKPIKTTTAKIIPVQYTTKCKVCGREIRKGELAYWIKYQYEDGSTRSFVICLDCYYKDTALAEWYLKKKKLEAVVRGLKKKADKLAEEIQTLQTTKAILEIKKDVSDIWFQFKEYLGSYSTDERLEKLQEFIDRVNDVLDRLTQLEASVALIAEPKISKKIKHMHRAYEYSRW